MNPVRCVALGLAWSAALARLLVAAESELVVLSAGDAVVVAPMTLVDGALHQPERTDLPEGGRATFTFRLAEAGDYEVAAQVDAPGGGANSYYLGIDAVPDGPGMIWDFDVTDGFDERVVSWRGRGSLEEPEFRVKVFRLGAGEHTLVLVGREPASLRSLMIRRHVPIAPGSLRDLQARRAAADRAFQRKVEFLDDSPESEEIATRHSRASDDLQQALFMQAVQLARATDAPAAERFEALEWVLLHPRSLFREAGPAAIELLRDHHADDPQIGRVTAALAGWLPDPDDRHYEATLGLFRAVLERNQDHTARGQAAFGLALVAKTTFVRAEAGGDAATVASARAAAETAFENLARDYGECADLRFFPRRADRTLGVRAQSELHEIRDLSLGRVAPEIDAVDISGTRMTLSEHRGKVVMLVFWASWCGPCMAAVPHENELVARFKDRPFVLVGVNGDESPEAARRAVKRHEIPWRSFWNGPADGPNIARAWNIRGWPTVYLIDHLGVIRDKYAYGPDLDARLEELMARAEPAR